MNAIATRTSTRCPTGIDVARTAGALVATYGENAAMIARKWAEVAVRGGDAARARDWRDIVDEVERRMRGDRRCRWASSAGIDRRAPTL
jgi:hypothetical protein